MTERYLFHEGPIPPGYRVAFELSLFNQQAHRELQAAEGWHSYYVLDPKNKNVAAAVHFHLSGNIAQSPLRAPFGSVEFSEDLPEAALFAFLEYCEAALKTRGVARIVIKSYPQAYHDGHAVFLHTFLLNLGYSVARAEAGTVIPVTRAEPETIFHRSEKRRLEKARQAGLAFKTMALEECDTVFAFIMQCRAEKKYSLSMTADQFGEAQRRFPDHYVAFGVFQHSVLAAASIAIRVKEDVLYDFYHDNAAAFDHLSPVALLVAGMYDFCHAQNIRLLDLGTSAVNNGPNFSLLTFKKFLGGYPTHKFTFEKILVHE